MAYNRVRSCKFYIDAMLLARQFGCIETENSNGLFYLNPTKTLDLEWTEAGNKFLSIQFINRYFFNSISHSFILGHNFNSKDISYAIKGESLPDESGVFEQEYLYIGNSSLDNNGWHKFEWLDGICTDKNFVKIVVRLSSETVGTANIGDISVGWSYEMPHSPDMELTQSFGNESLKTQTTKGGVTLTNTGWNHQPYWGSFPAWARGTAIPGTAFHSSVFGGNIFSNGRRSWNLKFSYVSDEDLFPSALHSTYGMFIKTLGDDPSTPDVETNHLHFSIKDNFVSKVLPTINLGLPFIFQPDSTVEEYAIVRANSDSVTFNQVANNVYDISMSITETF